ncbi:MAG: RHS repeat-associated core domain-containing protein, partial [Dehalococcoidales bacterium]|nr:RHS repeat-associated core domain-containing protein [Dehalococcoidales bacterium]
ASNGSSATRYGFTGEYTESGLLYLRARHYSPTLGRFQTRDTWNGNYKKPLSLNRWLYAKGNSINRTDPSGLCDLLGWTDNQGLFTEENCDALENDLQEGNTEFTEAWYLQLAGRERADGYVQAANNLEHYLNGRGSQYTQPNSFVEDTIKNAKPIISENISKLAIWYVRSYFNELDTCVPTSVGPETFARLINKPDYIGIGLGQYPEEELFAAAVGSFRIDVEIHGMIYRKPTNLLFSNVNAALTIHTIMFDYYNWNDGGSVFYPPRITGNKIKNDWAGNLEKNGNAKSFIARGDYIYMLNLNNIQSPSLFFNPNNPPDKWVFTSCIGSKFDIDDNGPGLIDYCGKLMQ